ncbi:iron-sulfur cluster assembly scaffold protein [Tsuneonella sp. YG55]|uniref:Iron-sulfur cluster assembly scaffold protein n=1 Tax=Tsuneonella litorea TaxID=2976475 RepID=A0A9X2W155_9SPHN|nr:iron-sulfur cluster assembly scaffold protein [Tsuneonella litorea]MCT2558817.1 iron-sulfur cluster assembly scaffold protein [Tsuneonella litorea]
MTAPARGGSALYTPDLLALAVSLGTLPFDPSMPLIGEARSRTCGSALLLSAALGDDRRIERLGLRVSACAVGQAAAALFANAATGCAEDEIAAARAQIAGWLAGLEPASAWPGLSVLEPARAHPARHGAILLPWDAALAALSKQESPR